MMCTKTYNCSFVSYDPRTVDHELRMFTFRINADEECQKNISDKIEKASLIVKNSLNALEQFKKRFA